MTLASDWPAYSDDSGAGVDGTIVNKSLLDSIKTAISNQVVSGTNPTVFAKAVIDEVVTARGNLASLAARIANVIDVNGLFVGTPSLAPVLGRLNLVANAELLLWPNGDTSYPQHFTGLSGTGSVQRCGTGLADVNKKIGDFCARFTTSAAGSDQLVATISTAASPLAQAYLNGRTVGFGAWVLCASANTARIVIYDGVGSSYSSYHSGGGTWEWLSVTRALDAAGTQLRAGLDLPLSKQGYMSGLTGAISTTAPDSYQPSPAFCDYVTLQIPGAAAVAASKYLVPFHRNGIVRGVTVYAGVAPTGADLIIDIRKGDAGTSLFTAGARPKVNAGLKVIGASAAPDGATYSARCFQQNNVLCFDIAQVGSGVAGSDLAIVVESLVYMRPLEALIPFGALTA